MPVFYSLLSDCRWRRHPLRAGVSFIQVLSNLYIHNSFFIPILLLSCSLFKHFVYRKDHTRVHYRLVKNITMGHNEFRRQVGRMATPIHNCTLGYKFLNYMIYRLPTTRVENSSTDTTDNITDTVYLSPKYTIHLSHLVFIMHLSRLWQVNCDFVMIPCMHTGFLRNYCLSFFFFFSLHSSDVLSVIMFPSGGVWEKKNSVCWHLRGTYLTQTKELCLYIRVLCLSFSLSLSRFFVSLSISHPVSLKSDLKRFHVSRTFPHKGS